MTGSGPYQTSLHQVELANILQQDELLNLEHQRDREDYQEGSMHDVHTDNSGFWRKSHAAHEQGDEKAMQREIDDLKKQLHRAKQKQYPSSSDVSSNDEEDTVYRQRSITPPSEFFPCEDEHFSPKETQEPFSQRSKERCYEKGVEPNLEVTLYTGDRKGKTS